MRAGEAILYDYDERKIAKCSRCLELDFKPEAPAPAPAPPPRPAPEPEPLQMPDSRLQISADGHTAFAFLTADELTATPPGLETEDDWQAYVDAITHTWRGQPREWSWQESNPAELNQAMRAGIAPDRLWRALDQAAAEIPALAPRMISVRRKRHFEDSGDDLDFDRALRGDRECWQRRRRTGRVSEIWLGVECYLSCDNQEQEFGQNIARAVAFAKALLAAGHRVGIKTLWTFKNTHDDTYQTPDGQRIRPCWEGLISDFLAPGQALDESRLLALGMPAVMRLAIAPRRFEEYLKPNTTRFHGDGACVALDPRAVAQAGVDIMIGHRWEPNLAKQIEALENLITQKALEA